MWDQKRLGWQYKMIIPSPITQIAYSSQSEMELGLIVMHRKAFSEDFPLNVLVFLAITPSD